MRDFLQAGSPSCLPTNSVNPLVHSVLLKGHYKKLDVKNVIQYSNEKCLISVNRTIHVYLENKSHALMVKLLTSDGREIVWSQNVRYLGVILCHLSHLRVLWVIPNSHSIGHSMQFLERLVILRRRLL